MLMLNKIRYALISIIILVVFSGTACFALQSDYASDPETKSTPAKQCFVSITKPSLKVQRAGTPFFSYDDSYLLCGQTDEEDVKIVLRIYNSDTDKYEKYDDSRSKNELKDTSTWKIGASGIFAKDIELNEGENSFRVIATKKSMIQITDFSITRWDESKVMDKIRNGIQDILVPFLS